MMATIPLCDVAVCTRFRIKKMNCRSSSIGGSHIEQIALPPLAGGSAKIRNGQFSTKWGEMGNFLTEGGEMDNFWAKWAWLIGLWLDQSVW